MIDKKIQDICTVTLISGNIKVFTRRCPSAKLPAGAETDKKKGEIAAEAAAEIASRIPAQEIKPILDTHFEDPFWNTLHPECLACGTCGRCVMACSVNLYIRKIVTDIAKI